MVKQYSNRFVFSPIGILRYLSLMKSAECVIENLSSNLIGTADFHILIVNIGVKQKRRLRAASIINTGNKTLPSNFIFTIIKMLSDCRK